MEKRGLGKWVGYASTLGIFIVGITSNMLGIPQMLRPWIFLASIVWIVFFSSGFFDS